MEERDTFDLITDIGSPTSGADGSNNNNNDKFSAATRKTRVMLSRNAAREAEEAMAAAAASSGYGNRREKKKREKVPQLTYLLREMDVAEDMSFIRKVLKSERCVYVCV